MLFNYWHYAYGIDKECIHIFSRFDQSHRIGLLMTYLYAALYSQLAFLTCVVSVGIRAGSVDSFVYVRKGETISDGVCTYVFREGYKSSLRLESRILFGVCL